MLNVNVVLQDSLKLFHESVPVPVREEVGMDGIIVETALIFHCVLFICELQVRACFFSLFRMPHICDMAKIKIKSEKLAPWLE